MTKKIKVKLVQAADMVCCARLDLRNKRIMSDRRRDAKGEQEFMVEVELSDIEDRLHRIVSLKLGDGADE